MAYLHLWAIWPNFTFGLNGLSSPLGRMAYLQFGLHGLSSPLGFMAYLHL